MSRLILVRHGETVWHAENRYAGRSDIALTTNGEAQAQALAAWAKSASISAVWSSTLSRARRTAEPAAKAAGVVLRTDARLIELDFGRGEGLTDTEMKTHLKEARERFLLDPVAYPLPDGEDPAAATSRGIAALHDIAREQKDGRTLIVAHNTLIRLTLCKLLEIPLSRYRTAFPKLANATLTEIDLGETSTALLSFNLPLREN